uniref:B box-type domain-containing protein n=1 Tax=Oryzias latipes TaxID=8090 RepID=A0A3P9L848_ORYLA
MTGASMRHGLIEPVENLEERVCEKHNRVLELFCRQEQVCICLLCSEAEHKDHQFVAVAEEAAQQRPSAFSCDTNPDPPTHITHFIIKNCKDGILRK